MLLCDITCDEFRKMLGLKPMKEIYEETGIVPCWPDPDQKLDITFARTEVRMREDGTSEFVITIPLKMGLG